MSQHLSQRNASTGNLIGQEEVQHWHVGDHCPSARTAVLSEVADFYRISASPWNVGGADEGLAKDYNCLQTRYTASKISGMDITTNTTKIARTARLRKCFQTRGKPTSKRR